ncbi:tetratricopeptide repeat protein [uncultured Jannaschia sp.]|uniref:tetratricopeptide repeat protein n=1 Tax=uncultured Jannaschia sp. TaxID=293347 RepID=UPI00263A1216|nr:tetratricopeptide repeat protein [uncultured Jannaschia sp.]
MTRRPASALRACLFAFALGPTAAFAQGGAAAFAAKDYAAAAEFWRAEAEQGSVDAMLGLARLADRGLGQARDPAGAFAWYLRAAEAGSAEAQFNVGVLYDIGTGTARDAGAATFWYTRAALRGNLRAQYNLGLIYSFGAAGAKSDAVAAAWFAQGANELPAARDKLAELAREGALTGELNAPALRFSDLGAEAVELVWIDRGGGASEFLVEVVGVPGQGDAFAEPRLLRRTSLSGLLEPWEAPAGPLVARVSALGPDGESYAASGWTGDVPGPDGRATLHVDIGDDRAAGFAGLVAADLAAGGIWVRIEPDGAIAAGDRSGVRYGYREDADLARAVIGLIPVLTEADAVFAPEAGLLPGEIAVRIAASRS